MKNLIAIALITLSFQLVGQIDLSLKPISNSSQSVSFILSGNDLLIGTNENEIQIDIDEFEFLVEIRDSYFSGYLGDSFPYSGYYLKTTKASYSVDYYSIDKVLTPDVELNMPMITNPLLTNSWDVEYEFAIVKKGDLLCVSNSHSGSLYVDAERELVRVDEHENYVYKMVNDSTYYYELDSNLVAPRFESGIYNIKKRDWLVSPDQYQVKCYDDYMIYTSVDTNNYSSSTGGYPATVTVMNANGQKKMSDIPLNEFLNDEKYKGFSLRNFYQEGAEVLYVNQGYYEEEDLLIWSNEGFSFAESYENLGSRKNKDFLFYIDGILYEIDNGVHKWGYVELNNDIETSTSYEVCSVNDEIILVQNGDSIRTNQYVYDYNTQLTVQTKDNRYVAFCYYSPERIGEREMIEGYDEYGYEIYIYDEYGYTSYEEYLVPAKSYTGMYDMKLKSWIVKPGKYDAFQKTKDGLTFEKYKKMESVEELENNEKAVVDSKKVDW